MRFDDAYFRSQYTYSALLLSRAFYEAFAAYDFILIYQLDALVFSDRLLEWCDRGYDYVGAPWVPGAHTPRHRVPAVGNGGLSLRNVRASLAVLDDAALARTFFYDPVTLASPLPNTPPLPPEWRRGPRRQLLRVRAFNNWRRAVVRALLRPERIVEDEFWGLAAPRLHAEFRVAPDDEAMHFAFEGEPRVLFARLGGALPFGCHAWDRVDRAFWEPHLEHGARMAAPSGA